MFLGTANLRVGHHGLLIAVLAQRDCTLLNVIVLCSKLAVDPAKSVSSAPKGAFLLIH